MRPAAGEATDSTLALVSLMFAAPSHATEDCFHASGDRVLSQGRSATSPRSCLGCWGSATETRPFR